MIKGKKIIFRLIGFQRNTSPEPLKTVFNLLYPHCHLFNLDTSHQASNMRRKALVVVRAATLQTPARPLPVSFQQPVLSSFFALVF